MSDPTQVPATRPGSTEADALRLASHRHYKGDLYLEVGDVTVVAEVPAGIRLNLHARHSEDLSTVWIYRSGDACVAVCEPGRGSPAGEVLVIYEHVWPKERSLWVRPRDMFHGRLEDGSVRFTPLRQREDDLDISALR